MFSSSLTAGKPAVPMALRRLLALGPVPSAERVRGQDEPISLDCLLASTPVSALGIQAYNICTGSASAGTLHNVLTHHSDPNLRMWMHVMLKCKFLSTGFCRMLLKRRS